MSNTYTISREPLAGRVNFDLIRYANCWEDPEVLISGLLPSSGSKILSIGSAGDNCFSLLTTDPEVVTAVDVSTPQLHLIELKKCCYQTFEREEMLAFLGFAPSNSRDKDFHSFRSLLRPEARAYWEANIELIRKGIVHQGKFEKYFQLFSNKILPLLHSKKTIEMLLATKTLEAQHDFYDQKWNTWSWRLLFRIFFSNYVMGKYGRDPQFQKHVKGSVSRYIFEKAARQLQSQAAQTNFMLRYTLTGSFGRLLPHYLQKENYDLIRSRVDRLRLVQGFAQDAIGKSGKFNAMNLSDIFEYMDPSTFKQTATALLDGLAPEGRLAYWNLMVPRQVSEILPDRAHYCRAISERLAKSDRGFFYRKFIVDQV